MGYFQKFLDPSFHNLPLKPSTRQNLLCASYETRCLVKFHPRNSLIYNNSAQTARLHADKDTNSPIRTSKKMIFDTYPDVCIFCKCLHLYQLGFCDKRIESICLEISTKHEIHVGLNVSICPSLGRANRTCVLIPSLPDVLWGDLLCTIHYVNNLNHESCWGKGV